MLRVLFHRSVRAPISRALVVESARVVCFREPALHGIVEIGLVGEKRMRTLNRRYRGVNRPTDVLSFPWQTTATARRQELLGQLYLCFSHVERQARRCGVPAREEFTRSLVHGLLHLAGYDHVTAAGARTMFVRQEAAVQKIRRGATWRRL